MSSYPVKTTGARSTATRSRNIPRTFPRSSAALFASLIFVGISTISGFSLFTVCFTFLPVSLFGTHFVCSSRTTTTVCSNASLRNTDVRYWRISVSSAIFALWIFCSSAWIASASSGYMELFYCRCGLVWFPAAIHKHVSPYCLYIPLSRQPDMHCRHWWYIHGQKPVLLRPSGHLLSFSLKAKTPNQKTGASPERIFTQWERNVFTVFLSIIILYKNYRLFRFSIFFQNFSDNIRHPLIA